MTRRVVQIGLLLAGAVSVGIGLWLLSFQDELFGEPYRPFVGLGLAFVVLGLPLLVVVGLQMLRPPVGDEQVRRMNLLGEQPPTAVALGAAGTILIAVTDEVGGVMVYHPYDILGLSLIALAGVVLVRWLMRLRAAPRP